MRTLPIALTVALGLVLAIVGGPWLPVSPAAPPVPPPAPAVASPAAASTAAARNGDGALAPELRLGLPDCPPGASNDLRGSGALECWFGDEAFGPWHIVSSLEIQGITIVRLLATDPGVADPVARRLVEQGGSTVEEVLVYAKPLRGPGVIRMRWTASAGYVSSAFVLP